MKVLYLNSAKISSEMANLIQVRSMCRAMSENGFDVILSIPGTKPKNINDDIYKYHFRKEIVSNKFDKYINIRSIIRAIRDTNPDIIFIRDPLLLLYVFLFSNKKILFETHNNNLHYGFNVLNRFYHFIIKIAINKGRVLKLICISNALADYWNNEGVKMEKIVVAHDGINMKMFTNIESKEDLRRKYDLPLDKIIITYSGRLYADRKIENILLLAKNYSDVFFLVVGGPDNNSLLLKEEAKRNKLNNVYFTGHVKHELIPEYLSASDILLALWSSDVPTINYCSPLKLFEYMAAKKTIVAHGFPTIKEVLIDGVDAFLVEPDDDQSLIEKLKEAIGNINNNSLAISAFNKVNNEYTWNKRVKTIFHDLV